MPGSISNEKKILSAGGKVFQGFLLILNDIIFSALACFLAYYLRFFTKVFGKSKPTYVVENRYIFYFLIFVGVVVLSALLLRLYFWNSINKEPIYYLKLMVPPVAAIIIMVSFGRIYERFPFSKLLLASLLVLSFIFLFFSRLLFSIIIKAVLNKAGYNTSGMLAGVSENIGAIKDLTRFKKKLIYGVILIITDIISLGLAFYLSYFLRFKAGIMAEVYETFLFEENYVFYSIIFMLSALFVFFLYNLYDRDKIYRGSGYYSKILKVAIINIIIIIFAGYIFNLFTFSRKWILLLFLLSVVLLFISRYLVEFAAQKMSKKLDLVTRTLIVGIGENAKRIEDSLSKYAYEADIIAGHVDKKQRISKSDEYTRSFTILGDLENLREIICKNSIQRVIISSPEFKYFEILQILEDLKRLDVTVLIFPGFFEFSLRRLSVREIGGVPLMQVSNIGFFGFNLFLKNLIDYMLGSIFFIFFIPIYLVVAILIKIDSKGPVFFKQKRLTKDCKEFYMYKFRTMYIDAEEKLKDLMKYNEADGPMFKMKNDPRITKIGRVLRKFSIDEIPQIINVLRGELSLVGPRPLPIYQIDRSNEWEMKRLNVKQGVTGLWQVSGRSDLSFEEMARLDLYYIQNWSIEMDIKIIIKTIPAALFGKGAY